MLLCSMLPTSQFSSLSLLVTGSDNNKHTPNARGETVIVASPTAFLTQPTCLSCLDELHSSLAAACTRKSVSHWELYRPSKNTSLALFYRITTQQESIDSCAQWMMISNNNKDHSDLQTTSLKSHDNIRIQGIVLCVGIFGNDFFCSLLVSELPSRLQQAGLLLPTIFASSSSSTTTNDSIATSSDTNKMKQNSTGKQRSTPKNSSSHYKQQPQEEEEVGDISSSYMVNHKIDKIKSLLASLLQENHPQDDTRNYMASSSITLTASTTTTTTTTKKEIRIMDDTNKKGSSATRCRIEAEQMEVMAIYDSSMCTNSVKQLTTTQQQGSMKASSTTNTPSLHGFDYVLPSPKLPLTIFTTGDTNSSPYRTNNYNALEQQQNKSQQQQYLPSLFSKFKIRHNDSTSMVYPPQSSSSLSPKHPILEDTTTSTSEPTIDGMTTTTAATPLSRINNHLNSLAHTHDSPTQKPHKVNDTVEDNQMDAVVANDVSFIAFNNESEEDTSTNKTTYSHANIIPQGNHSNKGESEILRNNYPNLYDDTNDTTKEKEQGIIILPETAHLTVSVALNEDVSCYYRNSKLLTCKVNGLLQLQARTDPPSIHNTPFIVLIKDPSQHIQAIRASNEYATDVTDGDDDLTNFMYIVNNIPNDRFVSVFKYKCNDNLCPVPLRIQMKSRLLQENRLRLSLQISSNPEIDTVLTDLDIVMMDIPSSEGEVVASGGGCWNPERRTITWRIPKLDIAEKTQLHTHFQLEDPTIPIARRVMVRCTGLGSQLSTIKVRLRDASSIGGDSEAWPMDVKMRLARRFRFTYHEQQEHE